MTPGFLLSRNRPESLYTHSTRDNGPRGIADARNGRSEGKDEKLASVDMASCLHRMLTRRCWISLLAIRIDTHAVQADESRQTVLDRLCTWSQVLRRPMQARLMTDTKSGRQTAHLRRPGSCGSWVHTRQVTPSHRPHMHGHGFLRLAAYAALDAEFGRKMMGRRNEPIVGFPFLQRNPPTRANIRSHPCRYPRWDGAPLTPSP